MPTIYHTRRSALHLILGGGATALATACTGARPTAPPAPAPTVPATPVSSTVQVSQPTQPTQTAQPKRGGRLRAGYLGNILTLDGHNYAGARHIFHVFDRLILLDERLTWLPRLAESWEINADYTQVVVHVRPGVMWHTGRDFTADDVAWNFNRAKDPSIGGGLFAAFVEPLASVDARDKLTVVFTTKRPYPAIGFLLQCLNMVDPVTMQQPDGANRAIGTGPFKFVEYSQGDHLTLARNPNYWRDGLPYLDEVYYQIFSDSQSLVTQLEARAIDVADAPPLRDAVRMQKDPNYRIEVNQYTGNNYTLVFNTTQAPTNNKLVRQALQYGIDRQSIVQRALLGIGSPQNLPWWPTSPAYDEAKNRTYGFDLDKARTLLQQAGVSDLQLDLNYSTAVPEQAVIGQIIQADLAKIGVTISLKPLDPNQLTLQLYNTTFAGLAFSGQPFAHMYPGILFAGVMTGPFNNFAGYRDDKWTAIATDMAIAVDPAKQKQAYAVYNDYMLDQSWVAYISTQLLRMGTLANVHGPTFDMAQVLDATEAWIG